MSKRQRSPLAIFSPIVGRFGQPWIKAHIDRILPGRTVVVAICAFKPGGPCWKVEAPLLFIPPFLPSAFTPQAEDKAIIERLPAAYVQQFRGGEYSERITRFLVEHGVETILAQWLDSELPLVKLAQELDLRYYCQAHGTDITAGLKDTNVRRAYADYNQTDAVVAPSEFGRQQLLQLGIRPERTRVIHHAVEVPERPPVRSLDSVRCLALSLDYVGDGSIMPALRQLARAFGIQDRVTFHGFLPHERVLKFMRRNHILIQASVAVDSRYDTAPVSVAEAMASGMAVVASRHGGIPEQIDHGESGFLVDEYDTRAMADRIVELADDPGLRQCLGAAAWHRARNLFSQQRVRAQWLELLQLKNYVEER
jgi:glycosyltransferase involved in cell wall biosynthesis